MDLARIKNIALDFDSTLAYFNDNRAGLAKAEAEGELHKWLRSSLTLYDDAKIFLQKLKAKRMPLIIVTAGDEVLQKEKIKMVGLMPDILRVVPNIEDKLGSLQEIIRKGMCPLI